MERIITCLGGEKVTVDIPADIRMLHTATTTFCSKNCNGGKNCLLKETVEIPETADTKTI